MGTTRESSDIYSVFQSIQKQLEIKFKIDVNGREYKEYKRKNEKRLNRLRGIAENKEFINKLYFLSENYLNQKKLIILLDSIDQLKKENYNLKWMFNKLPRNIKIIYSVLKNYENIFEILKREIKSQNILEIKPLKNDEAKSILSSYLKESKRQLVDKQKYSIDKMIDELVDICPLQVKLIFDIVSKWKSSYYVPADFLKCKTSIDLIKYLFTIIEKEIFDNETLFKRCLFYLTLFEYRGISENELEDILSIDDNVLDSIFVHHHPPVRRFPISLWFRIKYELKDYITNKMTDDVSVVAW